MSMSGTSMGKDGSKIITIKEGAGTIEAGRSYENR